MLMRSPISQPDQRSSCILLLTVALFTLRCGKSQQVTGMYSATWQNGFYWMQLVSSDNNQIKGQFETHILIEDKSNCHEIWRPDPSGLGNNITSVCGWKIQDEVTPVGGVIDGQSITISSVTPGFSVSGTLDKDRLTLIGGGQPSPMVFTRTSLDQYQQLSGRWTLVAQTKNAAVFPNLPPCTGIASTNCIN